MRFWKAQEGIGRFWKVQEGSGRYQQNLGSRRFQKVTEGSKSAKTLGNLQIFLPDMNPGPTILGPPPVRQ